MADSGSVPILIHGLSPLSAADFCYIPRMTERHTAIVTGAGSGIGQCTAVALALEGWNVCLVGRTPGKLLESIDWARRAGVSKTQLLSCPLDITKASNWHQTMTDAITQFGRLDALVNVAGYASQVAIEMVRHDEWERTIDTNLTAPVQLTAAAWPYLVNHGGIIVNVSSMASIDPYPGFAMYAAAKAGLNLFTLVTAREGQPHNIKAVCIAPGATETPMLRSMFDEKRIPKDKALPPEDVARIIIDCIMGRRQFEPGETIQVPSPNSQA